MKQRYDMRCQACYTFGEVDGDYFEQQATAVMDKLAGEEDIPFTIIALDDPGQCEEAFEEIPVEERKEFLETCRGSETSVSFRAGDQEFIVLKADKEFLSDDPAALRGLLAHELMHTVQRDDELGERIEDAARRYEDEMLASLRESGLSDEDSNRFIETVFQTAIFTLKDLFTNRDLIEQGFAEELEAYYRHMLGIESFCPSPDFYGEEAEVDEIQDAVTFELGLLPAWLPFEARESERSSAIRDRIEECYEDEVPRVAAYVHRLEELYDKRMDDAPDEFMDAFFEQVIEHSIDLMQDADEDAG
ncbi:MAG: hypothetical protein SVU88_03600 [Candidatus Nanohaloarchaea archaeon]|nr:hypothetical protein [Candidatus Nanohaloarchaea archaeon]